MYYWLSSVHYWLFGWYFIEYSEFEYFELDYDYSFEQFEHFEKSEYFDRLDTVGRLQMMFGGLEFEFLTY